MTQNQHTFLGIILMIITTEIYYSFFPREKEEKIWEEWIRDKFNL